MKRITIRPSSVKGFFDCPYRWYRDNLSEKPIRIVGYAAHFGSGVHKAGEVFYNECIKAQNWVKPYNELKSLAIDEFRERCKEDEPNDLKTVKINEVEKNIADIAFQYVSKAELLNKQRIPIAVEKTYEVKTNSVSVESVKGTLDIVGEDYIGDIKTMSRMKNVKDYIVQQGIYAFLRAKNGENEVKDLIIHRVSSSKPGEMDSKSILGELENPYTPIDAIVDKSKFYLETVIKTCDAFYKTGDELLFRGNPSSILCFQKYCAYYKECKFSKECI